MRKTNSFFLTLLFIFIVGNIKLNAAIGEPTTYVEENVYYCIRSAEGNKAGNVIGLHTDLNETLLSVKEVSDPPLDAEQFRLVPTGEYNQGKAVYHLQIKSNGEYLFTAANGWDSNIGTTAAEWVIDPVEDTPENTVFYIKRKGNSVGLGLDEDKVLVYTNKGSNDYTIKWEFCEAVPVSAEALLQRAKDALESTIKEANEALNNPGEFPAEAKEALSTAINNANQVLSNSTDRIEVITTKTTLITKISEYLESEILPSFTAEEGISYRIFCADNTVRTGQFMYLLDKNNNNSGLRHKVFDNDTDDSQHFIFEKVEDTENIYYIIPTMDAELGEAERRYVYSRGDGGSGMQVRAAQINSGDNKNETYRKWEIKYVETINGIDYFSFKSLRGDNYLCFGENSSDMKTPAWGQLRADETIDCFKLAILEVGALNTIELTGALNKAQQLKNETSEYAKIQEELNTAIIKAQGVLDSSEDQNEIDQAGIELNGIIDLISGLLNAIDESQDFYDNTEEGNGAYQYPVASRNALITAINTAKEKLNAYEEISELGTATTELETALSIYKDSQIIPEFTPYPGALYRIRSLYYPTKYMATQENGNNEMPSEEKKTGEQSLNQLWQFKAVEGAEGYYFMMNKDGDLALEYPTANNATTGFSMKEADPTNIQQQIKLEFTSFVNGDKEYTGYVISTSDSPGVIMIYKGERLRRQGYKLDDVAHPMDISVAYYPNDINNSALEELLTNAKNLLVNGIEGIEEGQYSKATMETFTNAINTAEAVFYNPAVTQQEMDEAANILTAEISTFESNININKEELATLITTATTKMESAVVGEKVGEYYQSKIDELEKAIETAQIAIARGYATQADKTALEESLTTFTTAANQSAENILDVMTDAIVSAQAFLDGAKIGDQPGEYSQAAATAFQTAINTASSSSKDRNALNALTEARKTFAQGKIPMNLEELKATILLAKEAIDGKVTGIYNGQYPEGAINTFQEIITKAESIVAYPPAEQTAIDAMNEELKAAIVTFESQEIVIDYSALQSLVAKAKTYIASINAVAGSNLETYLNTLKDVTNSAEDVSNSNEVTQIEVDEQISTLNDAIVEFIVRLKQAEGLNAAINEAINYIENTPTDVPELTTLLGELNALIAEGEELNNSTDMDVVTQAALKGIIEELSAKIKELVKLISENLSGLVDEAKAIHESAQIGTEPGQYTEAQKAALQTAITAAESKLNVSMPYYDEIKNEESNLANAINTFLSNGLNSLIKVAKDTLTKTVEGTKPGQYEVGSKAALEAAVTTAESKLEGATEDFATYYQEAFNTLKDALETYKTKIIKGGDGIDELDANNISVITANGKLYITGLSQAINISAYDMNGRMIFTEQAPAGEYIRNMESGIYVIAMKGYVNGNRTVIIK